MYKQYTITARRIAVILTVPIVSFCVTFLAFYIAQPLQPSAVPDSNSPIPTREDISFNRPAVVSFSVPNELRIKTINVTSSVYPVGLTSNGDMDITDDTEQTAWYMLGPKPGEKGSAVIAGHYGWKNGKGSIFNDLYKLVKGDEVAILDQAGRMIIFTVSHSELYAPNQDATPVFKSSDGKAHLNLITCQGDWNSQLSTYSERLVVFTDYLKHEDVSK